MTIAIIATIASLLIYAPTDSLLRVGYSDSLNDCQPSAPVQAGQSYQWAEIGLDTPRIGDHVCVMQSWNDRLGWQMHSGTVEGYQVFMPFLGVF